jgi:Co/Zn/Cd efflux system component
MNNCGCQPQANSADERRILWVALLLNAAMAVVGTAGGLLGHSTGLLADALDMTSDAAIYAIGLIAIGRGAGFKARAARLSGGLLLLLGLALLCEVGQRAWSGSQPAALPILGVGSLSLAVNLYVLRSLLPFQSGEVHLRATWIFTRADVIASVGVIASGLLLLGTGSRYPDLIVGAAIGMYVVKEAFEILREAHAAAIASDSGTQRTSR